MTVGGARQEVFFAGGKLNQRTACKTTSTTRSTLMPFMQRKSIGHSRKKHGEHGASDLSKRWRGSPGKPGPVNSGDVLPNGTITGVPSAAATCIGPVSLVSRTQQSFSKAISSRSEVLPARLKIADPGCAGGFAEASCRLPIADSIW